MTEYFQKLPESLKDFCEIFQAELPRIIPDNLIGIYIYGSISYGAFEENRSDVDVAAIIKRPFSPDEFKKLSDWYKTDSLAVSPWLKKLEMDFINVDDVLTPKNEIFTSRFASGELKEKVKFAGALMNLENLKSCGITLFGEAPEIFIPEINAELLSDALADKFKCLKENIFAWEKIDLWNQVYVVVQLCRVVYVLENNGKPVSKKSAAEWCEKNLPDQFRPMISVVLNKIDDFTGMRENIISENLPSLVEYVEELLQAKTI